MTRMSTRSRGGRVRQIYKFIESNRREFSVEAMCKILEVTPSGYYEWLKKPISDRAMEDARLVRLIRASTATTATGRDRSEAWNEQKDPQTIHQTPKRLERECRGPCQIAGAIAIGRSSTLRR
jgi:hypothetical protein